ncbi:MAG: hemolysin family protein [Phycisphaerales bacterium]
MTESVALWLAAGSTVLGSYISALHFALADVSRGALEDLAERRHQSGGTRRVSRILDDLGGHARAMALPRMICSVLAVACMVWYAWYLDSPAAFTLGSAVIAALLTALATWLFLVVIPMSIAGHVSDRVVYSNSLVIRALYLAETPLAPIARFLDEVIRRLAGKKETDESEQLEAELMSVIDEGKREGQFDEDERRMIGAVVQLRDRTVEQIMTPRTEILALEYTDDLGAVTGVIRKIGHSRIPVYKDNLDNIVGIFYVKDLMKWLAGSGARAAASPGSPPKPFELKNILRPAIFVPETKTARELMQELLERKVHIAMVADEYGGTAGLVTIEDVVETVFGEIYDEYEPEAEDEDKVEVSLDRRSAQADARAYIQEVNAALDALGVSLPEADEYDTLGGFVITTLGRIPKPGESFPYGQIDLHILQATPTRVLRVRLDVREPDRPDIDSGGSIRTTLSEADRAGAAAK